MNFDMNFNNAEQQSSPNALIPHGTECKVNMIIRPGGVGPEVYMTQSRSSDALMLDCEFTVVAGQYARRKFWGFLILQGSSEKAVNIGRSQIRAMIESSIGIMPTDMSEQSCKMRNIQNIGQIDGIEFACKVGIQKAAPNSGYEDKNRLMSVITPDNKSYQAVMSGQAPPQQQNNGGYAPHSPTQVSQAATASWQQPQQSQPTAPTQAQPTPPIPSWATAPSKSAVHADDEIPF